MGELPTDLGGVSAVSLGEGVFHGETAEECG